MERRIALAISMILVGVASVAMMSGISGAQQSTTTYTFEECEEGWTVESNSTLPIAPAWERSGPGHDSEFAFHLADYVDLQEEALVSPEHTAAGNEITISYWFFHDTEGSAEDPFDILAVEWSSDGTAWETLKSYSGQNEGFPDFIEDSATFTPPAGPLYVRFLFTSDDAFSSITDGFAGVAVDDVTIPTARPADATCASASPSGSPAPSGSPSSSVSPSPTPTDPPEDERGCTIFGTESDDRLIGTSENDVICAYAGADEIKGRGGNDKLYGDEGGDQIHGNQGNDRLKGGGGQDNLRGGADNDKHNGGGGSDECRDDLGSNRFKSCENG